MSLSSLFWAGSRGSAAHVQDVHADVGLLRGAVGVGMVSSLTLLNSKGAGRPAPFHHADIGM